MRKCKRCGMEKPIGEFPTYRARGIVGHRHSCRACWNSQWSKVIRTHNNRYYHENKGGYRDRQKDRTANQHRADPVSHYMRNLDYEKRHPERHAAKVSVMIAVRDGRLVRQPCEVCGKSKVHAHHDDYREPLQVMWLCPYHHGERHRLIHRVREVPA